METATNPAGWYTACGVPTDVELEVVAEFLDRGADTLYADLRAGDSRRLDFRLGLPSALLPTVTNADAATAGEGTQGVQGRVFDPRTQGPVVGADVILKGGAGGILAAGTTNERGFFRLLTRSPGEYALEVNALGYETGGMGVLDVEADRLSVVEIGLPPQAVELEPLIVVAEPRTFHLEMVGFYQRKEVSAGFFITPEMIEERHSQRVTQLFRQVPGAAVVQEQGGQDAVHFKSAVGLASVPVTDEGSRATTCWPRVYLDGLLMHEGGYAGPAFIDGLTRPFDLDGIEVYRSPAESPPRFGGIQSRCGVIVMWSKRGGGAVGQESPDPRLARR
jgi:hypothetical protein